MASTSAMNALSEQLVQSLLPSDNTRSKVRKHHDQFNRTLKHHNFARTNQFAVQEKLAGLEEKFQVLNREDLSDALFRRRTELNEHQHRWIPDVLDLLLSLSHLPVEHSKLETLDTPKVLNIVPASLKWADIEADDPLDRRSRLWRQPHYSDSSDDEEPLPSSTDTSPMKQKDANAASDTIPSAKLASIQTDVDRTLASDFQRGLLWNSEKTIEVSESQVVREVLHMVQGYPTALFGRFDKPMRVNSKFRIRHIEEESLRSVLQSAIMVAWVAEALRRWQNPFPGMPFMQVLEDHLAEVLRVFNSAVSQMQIEHLHKTTSGGVVSLLQTVANLHLASRNLQAARSYLLQCKGKDAIAFIDILFDEVCETEQLGNTRSCEMFKNIFTATFKSYCKPVLGWIQNGILTPSTTNFFVQRAPDQTEKARLWQTWYTCTESGPTRPPSFLESFVKVIFTTGKTSGFARALGCTTQTPERPSLTESLLLDTDNRDTLLPFAAAFSANLQQSISTHLATATANLQRTLHQSPSLSATLSSLSMLYLASHSLSTDNLEARLFSHLDRCLSTWNDRFMISDFISETFPDSLDSERVVVHSEPTSASDLPTARRSVEVLANVAFDYVLPWPIANIILPETLASYRRVALLLMQTRRAKYVLERRAYFRIRLLSTQYHSPANGIRERIAKYAQSLHTPLLSFVTTLYAHLTTLVLEPLTAQLHSAITREGTVDDLIALHGQYVRNMEWGCLTARNLKILKETVTGMLDVCVDSGFTLTSNPAATLIAGAVEDDGEAAVVVFEAKISKMKERFRKQLDFLIAGLRGVAKSTSSASTSTAPTSKIVISDSKAQGETMELLADSLESALGNGRRP